MSNLIQKVENFIKDLQGDAKKIEADGPAVIAAIQKDLTSYVAPLETMLEEEFPGATVPVALGNALLQGGLTLVSDAITAAKANGLNPTSDQAFVLAIKALAALFKGKAATTTKAAT
jgi:hypothetical protein